MGKLVVVSGSAGSGKGAVLKELFNIADYKYSVSATTRKPRSGEADGVNYYFLSLEEYLNRLRNGEMLEHVEYSGNLYGTPRRPIEKMLSEGFSVILEIEVEGALCVKEKFPEAVLIFLSPPTYAELERRLRARNTETEEVIRKRLEIAVAESKSIWRYDYLVVNETGGQKQAAFNIHCIIEAEKCRNAPRRAEEFLEGYFET